MSTAPLNPRRPDVPPKANGEARLIRASGWFGPSAVVFIEHRGERYQLRQTRSGKLILTK